MALIIDMFEPKQIEALVSQSVPTMRMTLNHGPQGIADYFWFCCDGHRVQVERKQIDEILSNIDGVEEQLGRELSNGVEETILLYEGTCEPIPGLKAMTQSWKIARDGKVMVPSHKYNISYKGFQAWLYQLDKSGITIVHTSHYMATAVALVALYDSSQNPKHTTLKRYIKEHITVPTFNPHVITLMGIHKGGAGEEIAKALIARFGTAHYTLSQEPESLAETIVGTKQLGIVRSKKLLRAFGRNV